MSISVCSGTGWYKILQCIWSIKILQCNIFFKQYRMLHMCLKFPLKFPLNRLSTWKMWQTDWTAKWNLILINKSSINYFFVAGHNTTNIPIVQFFSLPRSSYQGKGLTRVKQYALNIIQYFQRYQFLSQYSKTDMQKTEIWQTALLIITEHVTGKLCQIIS